MPLQVPTYDNFQVSPTNLPNARVEAPRAMDIAGRQTQQVGDAIMRGGIAASNIATDLQMEANKVRVADNATQAERFAMDLEAEYVQLKGSDALTRPDNKPLDVEFGEKLDTRLRELREGLGNDMQKALFDENARGLQARFRARAKSHALNEFKTYNTQVQDGRIKTYGLKMSGDWNNPASVEASRQQIRDAVASKFKGSPPEFIEAQTVASLSPAHTAVIAQAVQANNFDYARQYLEQYGEEMAPEARTRMKEVVEINQTKVTGENTARRLIGSAGSEWSVKAVDDMLVEKFGNDPRALEAARRELTYQDRIREESKTKAETSLLSPIQEAIGTATLRGEQIDKGTAEVLLTPLRNTSPDLYLKAAKAIDAHNDEIIREQQSIGTRVQNKTSVQIWADLHDNPNALRTAPLEHLYATGKLKENDYRSLVKARADLVSGKVNEYTLQNDNQVVKQVIENAFGKKSKDMSERELETVANVQRSFVEYINANGGKDAKLTQSQKQDIVRQMLTQVEIVGSGVFSNDKKRAVDVTINDIPKIERDKITAAYQANGVQSVTSDMILRAYIAKYRTGN